MLKFLMAALVSTVMFSQAHAVAPLTADDFQVSKDDEQFADLVSSLNLEDPKYIFVYKSSSTSVGMKVSVNQTKSDGTTKEKKLATWLPSNSAANIESQVVAYKLGQFLGMGDYVVRSAYYPLGPKAIARFKPMLNCAKEKGQHYDNCVAVLAMINKNPNSLDGVWREHVKDDTEVPGLIASAKPNGTLNTKSIIGQFISATGPMPSADKKMSLVKFQDPKDPKNPKAKILPTDTELNLAREFSEIMVLDVLTGQWDRFSGGNIEAIYDEKNDVVQFIAKDNGGASMNGAGYKAYYTFLTRFDADQIERVQRLLDLLQADPQGVATALELRSKPASLIARCQKLLAHVKSVEAQYGANKTYFPAPAQ